MKKTAVLILFLILAIIPKSFFSAHAAAAEEWKSLRNDGAGVACDGEGYLLQNKNGNRGVLAGNTSDKITLTTKIELTVNLIFFCETMLSDEFIVKLITKDNEGLILNFKGNSLERRMKAGYHSEDFTEEREVVELKTDTYFLADKIIENILNIQIEFNNNKYIIYFETNIKLESGFLKNNQEVIEIGATAKNEQAELSLELISGESSWSPAVRILSTVLHIENELVGGADEGKETYNEPNKPGSKSIEFPQKENEPPTYTIVTAVAGAVIAVVAVLLIVRNKRRKA